jgi:hypothetical protein
MHITCPIAQPSLHRGMHETFLFVEVGDIVYITHAHLPRSLASEYSYFNSAVFIFPVRFHYLRFQ